MLTIESAVRLAERYHVPLEDVLFIALNINGVNLEFLGGEKDSHRRKKH